MADAGLISGLQLQRESTAEQVAGVLRDQMLAGNLEAGAHLRETSLSEALGVSRNTVREAVQILAGQGLVTRNMHRGAFVTRLTPADVRDLYRVRRLVELAAVPAAAAHGADLSELDDAVRALAEVAERGEVDAIAEQDLRFHKALVGTMGSARLQALFDAAEGETRLSLRLVDRRRQDPKALVDDHRELLKALRAHDEARAGERLRQHLDGAEATIIRLLEERRVAAG